MTDLIAMSNNRLWMRYFIVKNNDSFVEQSFLLPKYNEYIIECKTITLS